MLNAKVLNDAKGKSDWENVQNMRAIVAAMYEGDQKPQEQCDLEAILYHTLAAMNRMLSMQRDCMRCEVTFLDNGEHDYCLNCR